MFTQIYRVKIQPQFNLNQHFRRLLESVYFKLRRMVPCALCDLEFRIDLPEPDEIQLCVIGEYKSATNSGGYKMFIYF